MKTKTILQNTAVALCASAFFLGTATDSFADKGGKGGKKGKPDKVAKKDHGKKSDHKKDWDDKLDKKIDKKDLKLDKKDWDDDWKKHYKGKDLPPGLAKKVRNGGELPPGWKNKVTKGWKIDDDYWKRLDLLDAADLPKNFKLKEGAGAYLLGDRVLQVDKDTKTVIDFVDLVLD